MKNHISLISAIGGLTCSLLTTPSALSSGLFTGAVAVSGFSGRSTNLQLQLTSIQLVDAYKTEENSLSLSARYIASWDGHHYANGLWFFTDLHVETTAKGIPPYTTGTRNGGSSASALWNQGITLEHLNPAPGEPDMTGQPVKIRIQYRVKGQVRSFGIQNGLNGGTSVNYRLTHTYLPGGNRTWGANVPGEEFDDAFWTNAQALNVGQTVTVNFQLRAEAHAAYGGLISFSDASISADAFISEFQVFDAANNLIWDHTNNPDGTPGDRFALVLYPPGGIGPPTIIAPGTQPPAISIDRTQNGNPEVTYRGILQQSLDLLSWEDVVPQPFPPWEITPGSSPTMFFRSRTP